MLGGILLRRIPSVDVKWSDHVIVVAPSSQRCFVHVAPVQDRPVQDERERRNSYLYVMPENVSEEFRSQLKFITSKAAMKRAAAPQEARADTRAPVPVPTDPSLTSDDLSLASASTISTMASAGGASMHWEDLSTTATRNDTARAFLLPKSGAKDGDLSRAGPLKERVQCPKPRGASPYARHADDADSEPCTLKNHYNKILHAFKPYGVIFPVTVPLNVNAKGSEGQNARSLMQCASTGSVSRRFQQGGRSLYTSSQAPPAPAPASAAALRQKHVEVVRMEVVKLDRKLRCSKAANANRELEHVLSQALDQVKAYEQLLSIEELPCPVPKSATAHGDLPFEMRTHHHPKDAGGDARPCPAVLVDGPDLQGYEESPCGSIAVTLTGPRRPTTDKELLAAMPASDMECLSKLERDAKLAKQQHNERLLDVLDIVNGVKVK